MDKGKKEVYFYIAFGVVLFVGLMNLNIVLQFAKSILALLLPIIAGLIIAFVLSVPMKGFENLINRIFKRCRRKPRGKLLHAIGLALTLAVLVLIVFLVCVVTIPEVVSSVKSVADLVKERLPDWLAWLGLHNIDTARISEWLATIDLENIVKELTEGTGVLIGSVAEISSSILSGFATAGIAFVLAIYVLLSRKDLARQSKKLLYAYTKETFADRICNISKRIQETYTKFLSGQCVEAVILGMLIFIAFSIFRLPYAGLIGILTGVFAFVPYVGAFASCAIGTILIFIADPSKALLGIVVYMVVQFSENQFIYPHVVGASVDLPPLWTLIAALIGGKLFGLLGMIFFIPLTSVIYSTVRDDVNRKNINRIKSEI